MNNKMYNSFLWNFLEKFFNSILQFVLQLILARLLAPEHYGSIAIMIIFINLANIFINSGLNQALVQRKETTEEDYSSAFWFTLIFNFIIYLLIFVFSPLIANYYEMPEIVWPFRVLALTLIIGSFNSVQGAVMYKKMKFREFFYINLITQSVPAVFSIILAFYGYGLWALVFQSLCAAILYTLIICIRSKWKPKFIFKIYNIGKLFSFSWKLLIASFMDTLYNNFRSLLIGKKYDSSTLGYYNKGKTFPNTIIAAINGTMQTIMLPVIASEQDNRQVVKRTMRSTMIMCEYLIFPAMAGLAAVATPLILVLLTDKWSGCVPYLQIYCFTLAFIPIHTCNLQTINALGRSDIFLKLEIIKKSIGVLTIIIAVFCYNTPIAIAMTGAITTITSTFINSYPNKKLIGYSYFEQLKDIFPYLLMSLFMCGIVLLIGTLNVNVYLLLVIQILSGILIYVLLSVIFKPEPYRLIINEIKKFLNKKKENSDQIC